MIVNAHCYGLSAYATPVLHLGRAESQSPGEPVMAADRESGQCQAGPSVSG